MKYRAIVQYKGTEYFGFSKQIDNPSIEACLHEALAVFLREDVSISVAGRTDAGVHALGQVISFSTRYEGDIDLLHYGINSLLPIDIQISKIEIVGDNFDARFSATARQYVYYILNRKYNSVLHRDYCYHYSKKIDIKKMKQATKFLIGEKDFSSFTLTSNDKKSSLKDIKKFDIEYKSNFFDVDNKDMIMITIKSNSFLHKMARNMVGTLIEVGLGNLDPSKVENILHSKNRVQAGPTAAAKGLFLEKVFY